jgi:hypothetical protein
VKQAIWLLGGSMKKEARDILSNSANENAPAGGLGAEISSLFAEARLDFDIRELRGYEIKPARFEE